MDADRIKKIVAFFLARKGLAAIAAGAVFTLVLVSTVVLAVTFLGGQGTPGEGPGLSTDPPEATTGYEEIIELMQGYIDEYQQQKLLKVTAGDSSIELSASRAGAPVDYDGLRGYLLSIGEDPELVADYRTVASAMNLPEPELNAEYIAQSLGKLQQALDPGRDGWYEVRRSSVVVHRGEEHLSFDRDAAHASVSQAFAEGNYREIVLEVSVSDAADPDWDSLYKDFCYEPVNARYSVDSSGKTVVVESSDGQGIDLEAIKESYRTGDWKKKTFLGFSIKPEIPTEAIDTDFFLDVLGEKTTVYNTAETSRAHNIELAAESINGSIVLPGYRFSFNNTVGERTEERGYQDALIYINDGIEPGLGGGICQVSSTLYNATLEAELKQHMRECHQFTVFYVDLGMDATVAWGNIDYIFENNTDYPIKIEATAKNGKLTMKVLGTADYETKEITFRYKIKETYPSITVTKVNETLPPGTKEVKSTGRAGYMVETYKTVVKDGEKYAEEWVATSIYDPLDTQVIEGPPLETTAVVATTTKMTTTVQTPPPETTKKPETSATLPSGTTAPQSTEPLPVTTGGNAEPPPA